MNAKLRVNAIKLFATVMELLPMNVAIQGASKISVVATRKKTPRVHTLAKNVAIAAGLDDGVEHSPLKSILVREALASYGAYWGESSQLGKVNKKGIQKHFVISEGEEILRAAVATGRGVIVALPHIGSWEWGGSYLDAIGLHMTAVAEELEPAELFEWFRTKRERAGISVVPLNAQSGSVLLSVLQQGGIVGLVSDRDLSGDGVDVTFFDRTVTMPPGPAMLALRTNAVLVTACCYQGPNGRHHAVVSAPIVSEREGRLRSDVERVTQRVATELEYLIRRAPQQWHVMQKRFE